MSCQVPLPPDVSPDGALLAEFPSVSLVFAEFGWPAVPGLCAGASGLLAALPTELLFVVPPVCPRWAEFAPLVPLVPREGDPSVRPVLLPCEGADPPELAESGESEEACSLGS